MKRIGSLLCTAFFLLGSCDLSAAVQRNAHTLESGAVRVEGRIIDALSDETDPDALLYLLIDSEGERVIVSARSKDNQKIEFERIIGATMSLVGKCASIDPDRQKRIGRIVQADPNDITVITNALSYRTLLTGKQKANADAFGSRQRVNGRVIACWPNDNVLIKTHDGQLVRASIQNSGHPRNRDTDLPRVGDFVEVVGLPEIDLLQNCLARCRWRASAVEPDLPAPTATRIPAHQLLFDDQGRYRVNAKYHGRRIIISGRITELASIKEYHHQLIVNCDNRINIPIYLPRNLTISLRPGSKVDIEGTCVIDTETWSTHGSIPRIRELLISVSDPSHIRVVQDPPWWTTSRLLSAIGGLLLVVFATIFWNLSLRRVLKRKSQALENELAARLESNLKTRERTRLAVELHDSISQNLSGLAMEIGSAVRLAPAGIDSMLPHLKIASRTLQSCRDDLRDCLWDLRSNALEERDMNDAIHTTLRPYVTDATTLRVRFNVSRKVFSDNLAHTLLRIIRELVSNAIRHGGASEILIAGTIDGRKLLFSVRDNGCGFDPDNCPGIEQGHFGLQGIRERIQRFDGKMDIDVKRSVGSKISITMNISFPQEEDRTEP